METYIEEEDVPDCFILFHLFRLAKFDRQSVKDEDAIRLDSS